VLSLLDTALSATVCQPDTLTHTTDEPDTPYEGPLNPEDIPDDDFALDDGKQTIVHH